MPVPIAPTSFAATPTPYGILLTWDTEAALDGFYLYRGVLANHSDALGIPIDGTHTVGGAATSFMDVTAAPGTHYYYQLQASSNADGESTRVNADAVAQLAGMTLVTARRLIRYFARNAGDSTFYTNAAIDFSLQSVGQRFCRNTRALITAPAAISLAVDDASFVVAGTVMPEQILGLYLSDKACPLELTDYGALKRLQVDQASSGSPRKAAILSNSGLATTFQFWPTNDAVRTVQPRYWTPFTIWEAGTIGAWSSSVAYIKDDVVSASSNKYVCILANTNQTPPNATYWTLIGAGTASAPASITLSLPEAWLSQILPWGPPAILQATEPEHAFANASWQKYLEVEKSFMGAGDLAVRSTPRAMQM